LEVDGDTIRFKNFAEYRTKATRQISVLGLTPIDGKQHRLILFRCDKGGDPYPREVRKFGNIYAIAESTSRSANCMVITGQMSNRSNRGNGVLWLSTLPSKCVNLT
jgi:hypothetical protein